MPNTTTTYVLNKPLVNSAVDEDLWGGQLNTNMDTLDQELGTAFADTASAATTDIGAAASRNVRITGTTTITSFGTSNAGITRRVRFAGILTLTHNGTSLILPGTTNITTAADDRLVAVSLGSGNWIVMQYQRADGTAIIASTDGRLLSTQIFTSSGTWTKPAGINTADVIVVGGGGGGGFDEGGGAGAGGVALELIDVSGTASETITIGAGGAGDTDSTGSGVTGGTSSFGSFCSATGGVGGNSVGSSPVRTGGTGGAGSGGDVNISGGGGGAAGTSNNSGGLGGTNGYGGGGTGGGSTIVGSSGGNHGGGGGGGGANAAGGAGAGGVIIVKEYS